MEKNEYGRVRQVGKTYENGYWDKITYWSSKLNEAIASKNLRGVDSAHRKLDYFIGREWDTNPTKGVTGEKR
jgi:sulfur relay (sulfurtransferase) DsrC/TusE family protein